MQENALISVVIPSFNRKHKLPAAMESVLNQSYKNIELIVVDDASTDGTAELFENIKDPRVKFYRYEENRGACYARNYGAERAQGELIAFQDSDDIWQEDKLEKQYRNLIESGRDMCYCGMNRVAANGNHFYYPVHAPQEGRELENFLAENRASTQTMLMYKSVWAAVRFDDSIRRYQDWDFAIRVAGRFGMSYLPEALVESEVGTDSISTMVNSYPHLLRLYNKHAALYAEYPASDAVMNRRLGKRIHPADAAKAAAHFKKSFKLSHSFYDLSYLIADSVRAILRKNKDGLKT